MARSKTPTRTRSSSKRGDSRRSSSSKRRGERSTSTRKIGAAPTAVKEGGKIIMDSPQEKIEVGLDAKADQITIVVGTDWMDQNTDVQSVVVLKSGFKNKKAKGNIWNRRSRSFTRLSKGLSSLQCQQAGLRSELLRPDSPVSLRPSALDGRRSGERDPTPATRGRDSVREDRGHASTRPPVVVEKEEEEERDPPMMIPQRLRNGRSSKSRNKKIKQPVIRLDAHGYHNLPPMEESTKRVWRRKPEPMTKYRFEQEKPRSYLSSFRNNRVDPVVMVSDCF